MEMRYRLGATKDGRLVVCGGSIFVMDESDDYTMQFTHVHDIPPGVIAAGNPAKPIKDRPMPARP